MLQRLQDLESIGMAECLLKQPKCNFWNIECTFIDLPVSIPLGVVSLAGANVSGVSKAPTSKYQKELVD